MSNKGDLILCFSNDKGTERKDQKRKSIWSVQEFVCSEGILLVLGLIAIALDPLFFYIPIMKNNLTCLGLDKALLIVAVIVRTFVDALHDWSWWSKNRFGRKQYLSERARRKWISYRDILQNLFEWIKSFKMTSPAGRSSTPSSVIAIMASLPLPQVAALALDLQSGLLACIILGVTLQFVPRYFRVRPTYVAVTTNSTIYAWIGAAYNLLLFALASHALGGYWYLRAVERRMDFMVNACRHHEGCVATSLYCEGGKYAKNKFINDICAPQPASNATAPFDYGIYKDAENLIGSTSIINKLSHGFWWGLSNLSSMAQNLEFNNYIWDTCFEIFICILGLFLFALLIGNLQIYVQSKMPSKLKKLKEKNEQLHTWAPFRVLPREVRKEVYMCRHHKWLEVSGVNLESFLNNIPWDLKKKLKQYFYDELFHKVKAFEKLPMSIKKDLRDRARPVVFQARTIIYEEGHLLCEMIHIVEGKVFKYNNNDASHLRKDDSFGEELLQKALESPSPKLPKATYTFQCMTKVEAFALSFDDFATIFTKYGNIDQLKPYREEWAVSLIRHAYLKYKAVKNVYELIQKRNDELMQKRNRRSFPWLPCSRHLG